jgi:hypothetical protein
VKTFELVEKLHELMRQTGKGGRDIFLLIGDELLDINDVRFDEANNYFYLTEEKDEQG